MFIRDPFQYNLGFFIVVSSSYIKDPLMYHFSSFILIYPRSFRTNCITLISLTLLNFLWSNLHPKLVIFIIQNIHPKYLPILSHQIQIPICLSVSVLIPASSHVYSNSEIVFTSFPDLIRWLLCWANHDYGF